MANRGLVQAAGSWSLDACCANDGNDCHRPCFSGGSYDCCTDRVSSSDWLFGLWPGPPQRFEPTGTNDPHVPEPTDTAYQTVSADQWPVWGNSGDLAIGYTSGTQIAHSGAPGGSGGYCSQGSTYRGTPGEICGGGGNWGATDVEMWYPR